MLVIELPLTYHNVAFFAVDTQWMGMYTNMQNMHCKEREKGMRIKLPRIWDQSWHVCRVAQLSISGKKLAQNLRRGVRRESKLVRDVERGTQT